ncbi:MAG: crotonase/enoyl-CoA hydratase family protein [Acidimicrobiales bacterium]|jgi:enoyl-CoA hydratase|nr:crotonase/enoyl-CoA hydratase family protein [Acidimicrobiales bacterium]MDP6284681.1 crotonase/enoyl-CoA hydratase family protein [Acidimicrobiales bacterium]HJO41713.1 crotonase/enoyl-CoA hydratase family protein [Acidimicrobiales bacterium]
MSDLTVEKDGSILVLTMNRPNRQNAMTLPMFARLADAWEMIDEDLDIRVCILTGAAGNFSSGMDLRSLSGDSENTDDYDVNKRMTEEGSDFIYRGLLKTKHPRVPLIAAVEGNAIAGGTEILQGTDIRVAGESAVFGVSEVKWSLYPMGGSAVRLARQIPFTEAADILLTGKHITAEEAKNLGLIGHVVDDGKAMDKSMEIAETICQNGPLAVEGVLRTLRETTGMTEQEAFEYEDPIGKEVFASQDAKEGPKAFTQKRPPEFKRR